MKDLQFIAFILSIQHYLIPPPIPNSSLLCPFFLQSRNNLQELHELQEEKLLLSQIKCKSSMEKTHRKSFKRASKHGNTEEVKTFTQQELSSLISEQEKKVRRKCSREWRQSSLTWEWYDVMGGEGRDRLFGMIGQEIAPRFDWVVENN